MMPDPRLESIRAHVEACVRAGVIVPGPGYYVTPVCHDHGPVMRLDDRGRAAAEQHIRHPKDRMPPAAFPHWDRFARERERYERATRQRAA